MANLYNIAVRIALSNGMSPVLAVISRDLLGINTSVHQIEKGFGRWAQAAGGAMAAMAGSAMVGGLLHMAEHGAAVNHQLELMKLQGMQIGEVHAAAAKAMAVSGSVLTSTYTENLAHIRELRYAFGNTSEAMQYLEAVTKANATLNAMKGGGSDQVWELVKGLEQKGLTADPKQFMSYVNQMTKAVVASGGMVTPAMFQSAFKYGRTAMLGWDETFVTQYLPRLIQSMSSRGGGGGSGGPGNALMSAFAKVVQGQMPKGAAEIWKSMGLATIEHIAGSSQSLTNVATKGQFQRDPYQWVQNVLVPALRAHNITAPDKIIEVISRMFPVRTASQIVTEMALQGRAILGDQSPFEKDARLQREAFDQRMSYDELIKNDYQTTMLAFHDQWENLNDVLGAPLSKSGGPLVQALAWVTHLMNQISRFAQANPAGIEIVARALAALAASLVVGGLIALGAAIVGLVGVGGILVALAAGLATLAALNWNAIKAGGSLDQWFNRLADNAHAALVKWASEIGTGFDSAIKEIGSKIHDALIHLPGYIWNGVTGLFHHSDYRPNYVPPAGGNRTVQVHASLNVDGRKLAEAVTRYQVRDGAGPAHGSPYHDATYSTSPVDLVLA